MDIRTILIVDDDDADQFLAKYCIEQYDPAIDVWQAYDGQEALDMIDAAEKHPDLIILDINMPGMNGFEFLETFCPQCNHSIVVTMLSSSSQEKDKDRSFQYPCVKEYFLKPLSVAHLEQLSAI